MKNCSEKLTDKEKIVYFDIKSSIVSIISILIINLLLMIGVFWFKSAIAVAILVIMDVLIYASIGGEYLILAITYFFNKDLFYNEYFPRVIKIYDDIKDINKKCDLGIVKYYKVIKWGYIIFLTILNAIFLFPLAFGVVALMFINDFLFQMIKKEKDIK